MRSIKVSLALLSAGIALSGCVVPSVPAHGGLGYDPYRSGYYASPQPTYSSQRAYDLNMPDGYVQRPSPYNRAMRPVE
jgi:hypothetical protein